MDKSHEPPMDAENKRLLDGLKRATLILNCDHCKTQEFNVRADNVLVCAKCGEINDYIEKFGDIVQKETLSMIIKKKLTKKDLEGLTGVKLE